MSNWTSTWVHSSTQLEANLAGGLQLLAVAKVLAATKGWLMQEPRAVMTLGRDTGEKHLRKGNLLIVAKEWQDTIIWILKRINIKVIGKWRFDLVEFYGILWFEICREMNGNSVKIDNLYWNCWGILELVRLFSDWLGWEVAMLKQIKNLEENLRSPFQMDWLDPSLPFEARACQRNHARLILLYWKGLIWCVEGVWAWSTSISI